MTHQVINLDNLIVVQALDTLWAHVDHDVAPEESALSFQIFTPAQVEHLLDLIEAVGWVTQGSTQDAEWFQDWQSTHKKLYEGRLRPRDCV